MEFLHLCIMLNQKSQDIAVPDGVIKVLFSQEQFTLPDCFFSVFRVNSRKGQKESVTVQGEHSAYPAKDREEFLLHWVS